VFAEHKINMNMDAKILNQELATLQKNFAKIDLEDIESKVSNLKQRIFMMNRKLGFDKLEVIVQKPTPTKPDTRAEMDGLRAKLMPKKTVEEEMAQTDKELDDALKRALAKRK